MAGVTLLGFDHLKQYDQSAIPGAVLSTLLSSPAYPGGTEAEIGPIYTNDQTTMMIKQFTLSNGIKRNFLCHNANNYSRRVYPRLQQTHLANIPKVGKWYVGCRVYLSNVINAAAVLQVRLSTGIQTITIPAGNPGFYYVEVMVDWANQTITGWLNGVQQFSVTGSANVDPAYASPYLNIGPIDGTGSNTNSATYVSGFTDYYFIAEAANESNPIGGRLGPILVKPQVLASVANATRFTPPGTLSVVDQFNSNNVDVGATTDSYTIASNSVKTSANGDIATAKVAAPTETKAIKAVTVQVLSHKLSQAAAGVQTQLKQGGVSQTAQRVVPGTSSAPTRQAFGYTKAFDGSDWTNDKVGQITVDIGSYRP